MTTEELNEIESTLATLPARPWRTDGETYCGECCTPRPIAWALEDATGAYLWSSGGGEYAHPSLATGTFIAKAPDTIAALVAEVRALRELLAEAREAGVAHECWDCGIDEQPVWERIRMALEEGRTVVVAIEPAEPPRPLLPPGITCPKCHTLLTLDGACTRCGTMSTERP